MPRTFFTADWHLGESRMEILQRPFSSIEEHEDALITLHNSIVAPDDEVYVVGDVCFDPSRMHRVREFNGKKILIKGNHDRKASDEEFSKYFERIVPEGDGIELDYNDMKLFITHYPTRARPDRFNLVGHIHAFWKVQLNSLNVGVDVHHFRPLPLDRVPFFFKAICEYYDDDAWAAYHDANMQFRGQRGKKGSYFGG